MRIPPRITAHFGLVTCILFPLVAMATDSPSETASLVEKALKLRLHEETQWRRLLHYRTGVFGKTESEVDSASFFLSPDGKNNPEQELRATVSAFLSESPNPTDQDSLPHCRFPARYQYIKARLGLDQFGLPDSSCPKYEDFKKRLSAESASLVFSSFYLNNPSSAFGHSFLRINSTKSVDSKGQRYELLDTGINYAAVVDTANPILYALYGLTGAFKGTFTAVPYYYKVREYNDYEERDLWSYELNLTAEELERLVAHLWELGPAHYDYFYFSENCSYHMFTTLEAAAPRLHLIERIPFYVIPSDTMRALMAEPGLVKNISYRPSVRTVFEHRLSLLNEAERDSLSELLNEHDPEAIPADATPAEKAKILDTALDYLEFKNPEDLLRTDTETAQWKQAILLQRARLGVRSDELKVPTPERESPHLGHGVRRLTLESGYEGTLEPAASFARPGAFSRIGMRFALNDLLDPGPGYPHHSQIEFFNFNLRYLDPSRRLELDDLTLFRITSLSPTSHFKKATSFRVDLGYKKLLDRNCAQSGERCGALSFEAGPGLAVQPTGHEWLTFFGFTDFQLSYSGAYSASPLKVGLGPSGGAVFLFNDHFRSMFSATYRYQLFSLFPHRYELKGEVIYGLGGISEKGRPFAIGLRGSKLSGDWEAAASMKVYW